MARADTACPERWRRQYNTVVVGLKPLKRAVRKLFGTRIQHARSAVARFHQILGSYRRVLWLIADGRSGTTWISSLINHDGSLREMFEPFHPFNREVRGFFPDRYIRPGQRPDPIERTAREIFSGRLTNRRIDQANDRLWFRGLLIKDIFANLLARWALDRFPRLLIVLLVSNRSPSPSRSGPSATGSG